MNAVWDGRRNVPWQAKARSYAPDTAIHPLIQIIFYPQSSLSGRRDDGFEKKFLSPTVGVGGGC